MFCRVSGFSILVFSFKCSLMALHSSCNESRGIGYTLLSSGFEYKQICSILPSSINFGTFSPIDTEAMPSPDKLVYSPRKIIVNLLLETFQACDYLSFPLNLLDWNATHKTCTKSLMKTHLLFFFSSKIKRQKDAISAQRFLL